MIGERGMLLPCVEVAISASDTLFRRCLFRPAAPRRLTGWWEALAFFWLSHCFEPSAFRSPQVEGNGSQALNFVRENLMVGSDQSAQFGKEQVALPLLRRLGQGCRKLAKLEIGNVYHERDFEN